jgi:hypothetical protein
MENKIHLELFLKALRTSIIFISGFLAYDWLKQLEIRWNKAHSNNEFVHFARRKTYHFVIIFLVDLIILYSAALSFGFLL